MGVFRFKQFTVDQRDCAMKINTDGVLLGVMVDGSGAARIIDVGTGTGVIAMMLAQRFPKAELIGVEIDKSAANRAAYNVNASPFSDRIQVVNSSFQESSVGEPVDLVVTNPPFYTRSLHSPDARRKMAKHTDMVFFEEFFSFCHRVLSPVGEAVMIVPPDLAEQLLPMASKQGLVCNKKIEISSFPHSEPIRCVLGFSRQDNGEVESEQFYIYEEQDVYSDSYRKLLKPFFLAF